MRNLFQENKVLNRVNLNKGFCAVDYDFRLARSGRAFPACIHGRFFIAHSREKHVTTSLDENNRIMGVPKRYVWTNISIYCVLCYLDIIRLV